MPNRTLSHITLCLLVLTGCPGPVVPDGGTEPGDGGFFRPFAAPATSGVNNSLLVTITGRDAITSRTP